MKFNSIYSQNFMSIGPDGVFFQLDDAPVTVVVGKNGSGKSTGLIDGLYYNLFGKPFRKDFSMAELVNDEVKKEMLTISNFIGSDGNKYEVKRGRKHAVEFEIYKNDKLVPVPADLKQYQKYLEETVLGFDAETFKQVIILGSSAYVPFMKLGTADRRKVVEDLLAIRIFSFMNDVAKDDARGIRTDLDTARQAVSLAQSKVTGSQNTITSLKNQSTTNVEANTKTINDNNEQIKAMAAKIEKVNAEIAELNASIADAPELKAEYSAKGRDIEAAEREQRQSINAAKFYKVNTVCPECKQKIAEDFRNSKFTQFRNDHDLAKAKAEECQKEQDSMKSRLLEIRDVMGKVQTLQVESRQHSSKISSLQMTNQHLLTENQRQSGSSEAHMVQATETLKQAENAAQKATEELEKVQGDYAHIMAGLELLKDGNIKGDVIKNYIPIINREIQKNLSILEFPAQFSLDEKFKETITLQGKKRSYAALSEGQKLRVDLAILFAWRTIAATKNSANSSLIIFDEIGSSSLDAAGMALFQKLVDEHNNGGDSNVFTITHDHRVASEYPKVIEVSLQGKYTTIKSIES